jgi:hypothetical protein
MLKFKWGVAPSCSNCKYANVYIPLWSYPHTTPYCEKGHGKCSVSKLCEDYELIGRLSR